MIVRNRKMLVSGKWGIQRGKNKKVLGIIFKDAKKLSQRKDHRIGYAWSLKPTGNILEQEELLHPCKKGTHQNPHFG